MLRVPYYRRYADDIVLMSNNKRKLHYQMNQIIIYARDNLHLQIKSNYQIYPIRKEHRKFKRGRSIDFVGKCFSLGYTTIRKRRALKIMQQSRKLLKRQQKGQEIAYKQASAFISRIAVCKHCNCKAFYDKYVRSININELKHIISKHDKKLNSH